MSKKRNSVIEEVQESIKLNYQINSKFKNKKQKLLAETIKNNRITFVTGSPGTGKTFIALKTALELLKTDEVGDIILTTPIIEVSPKSIGALPGDLDMKINHYFQHFYDNLDKLVGNKTTSFLKEKGYISDKIVNFIRGATFGKTDANGQPIGSFCVLDECFTGDTLITKSFSNNKKINIKTLYDKFNKGEDFYVESYNEKTHKIENKKVTNVFKNENKNIKKVYLDGHRKPINTTENHPFSVFDKGLIEWKLVSELKEGDEILRYKKVNSNNSNLMLSDSYDILLGFMLGEGLLLKTKQEKTSYRLTKTHSLKQFEYMAFCKEIFKNTLSKKDLCSFSTKSMVIDKKFISSIIKDNKKYISNDIYNYFSIRTLALWYMDSGYYHKNKTISFNIQGFCQEEVDVLCNVLKNKFGFEYDIDNTIRLYKKSSEKMLEMVKDYLHPTMLYKSEFETNNFNKDLYNIETVDNLTTTKLKKIEDGVLEDTYNIEVQDNNNYFAGNHLVHNCQNLTVMELKTYISRLGEKSKMVILGDVEQCDLKLGKDEKNSLSDAIQRFKDMDGIGIVEFDEDDIVRDPFLIDIMKKYKQ